MASPSPKRRRLSPPETSRNTNGENGSVLRRTPMRPSHLSPTKASLARFHPHLLPRPSMSPNRAADRNTPSKPKQTLTDYVLGGRPRARSQSRAHSESGEPTGQTSEANGGAVPDGHTAEALGNGRIYAQVEQDDPPVSSGEAESSTVLSSPSKMPMRHKVLARNLRLSSPRKADQAPPLQRDQAREPSEELEAIHDIQSGGKPEAETTPAPSAEIPVDPQILAKRQEKEKLTRQLEEIQRDVQAYERELGLIGDMPDLPTTGDKFERLINLFDGPDPTKVEQEKPSSLSQLLTSFLPFSRLRPRVPTPPPSSPEKLLPSHAPVDVEDPLPYLQLFTQLECRSIVTAQSPPEESEANMTFHQNHTLDITGPQAIFRCTIELTLDPIKETVEGLIIRYLPLWAEHELGTWARKRAEQKDIGNVLWAMNSYLELSRKRAECWIRCERALGKHLVGANVKEYANVGNGEEDEEVMTRMLKYSKQELQRYLGKDFLLFKSEEVAFRVSWEIGFDWSGEAESRIKAQAAFPEVWQENDDRQGLKKVSPTFDNLVQDKGVFAAISIMVSLLFG